jgi:tetratricopeptide (TPR) repeat protein
MAEKSKNVKAKKSEETADTSTPAFDPKPVTLGGESFVERVMPHIKKIAVGAIVLAVILGGFFSYLGWQQGKREAATGELTKVINLSDREVRPEGQAPEIKDPKDPKADKAKPLQWAEPKERVGAMLAQLAPNAPSGPVYRGSLLAQLGHYDEALAAFREKQGDLTIQGVLAREGIGLALEQKATAPKVDPAARQKGLEEALAEFKVMQTDDKGPRRAYALYHQGRILYQLNKLDDAKAAWEQARTVAKTAGKTPELSTVIDERLASVGA